MALVSAIVVGSVSLWHTLPVYPVKGAIDGLVPPCMYTWVAITVRNGTFGYQWKSCFIVFTIGDVYFQKTFEYCVFQKHFL